MLSKTLFIFISVNLVWDSYGQRSQRFFRDDYNYIETTIEGKPLTQVYSIWELHEPNNAGGDEDCVHIDKQGYMNDCECDAKYNYICKKALKSLEWNDECNMPNLDYKFNKDTGNCYKIHTTPLTWAEASAMCEVEHTSLAMITDQLDAYHLVKLTESTPTPRITENYQRGIYHLGFHNRLNEGWQTVKGIPINVDDEVWYDSYQPEGRMQCGSMFYTGRLVNIDCEIKCFFICQHKPGRNNPQLRLSSSLQPIVPFVSGFADK
ncbi:hypothetical protein PYW08_003926 [Mythimna loreyi]|uniref:Uncharacterized protein n=1 Tax=Mythimna loreyi TaxID=667449 RepID=A0ACC2QWP6_9NEOP|nr:hypothetical protein PYW08_003926 [Mythimna loreyi]